MKKFIVLVSGDIGGAEKRFFDIFRGLYEKDENTFLVLPKCLYNILNEETHIKKYSDRLVVLDIQVWSPIKYVLMFYWKVLRKSSREDVFHYPLNPPFFLHFICNRKYSISYCDCYNAPTFNLKNKNATLQWASSFFASKVDILSPQIFKESCDRSSSIANKAKLTPGGTFIFASETKVIPKQRRIAFVSRLEPGKGVERFFVLIPLLSNYLAGERVQFDIYGTGSLELFVKEKIGSFDNTELSVTYHGYGNIDEILPEVWCVCSLQEVTNFPSRVVAESLLNGCEVLILDSGDSRQFGDIEGISYLSKDYSNLEKIAHEVNERFKSRRVSDVQLIADNARKVFSSEAYLEYFMKIFQREDSEKN